MISYAQNFEDVMLARALSHIEKGCYIDVGAQHPIIDSVSLNFYERGWRGIHIEPIPEFAQLLRQFRPDETVIEAAIGDGAALISLFEIPNSGLSTARTDIANSHRASGFTTTVIEVPCISLAAILDRAGNSDVHWLKIDVEGMESNVLRSWDPSHVRPWIVLIEATKPLTSEPNYMEWEHIVLDLGYKFAYFDGLNRFYISASHEELLQKFKSPPNVFDAIELAGTASNTLSRRLQRIVDDTRAEVGQLDLRRQTLESVVEEQKRDLKDNAKISEALSQTLTDSKKDNDSLSNKLQEFRLRDGNHIESQRLLTEELSRMRATIEGKDRQVADASMRIEELYRQRDAIREKTDQLLAAERAQAREMSESAKSDRATLYRVSVERENQLIAQLGSITNLMQAQTGTAEHNRKTLEIKICGVEEKAERLHLELNSILGHWTGRLYTLLTARRWSHNKIKTGERHQALRLAFDDSLVGSELSPASVATNVFSNVPPDYRIQPDALLLLPNEAFLAAVYQVILGRQADQSGFQNYMSQLRGGKSKANVVYEIANSVEGRVRTPETHQLARFIAKCGTRRKWKVSRFFSRPER